jgi:hypothetical protein
MLFYSGMGPTVSQQAGLYIKKRGKKLRRALPKPNTTLVPAEFSRNENNPN